MKTAIALLSISLLFVMGGCRGNQIASPQDDSSEILIRHLNSRIGAMAIEISKRDKECEQDKLKETKRSLSGQRVTTEDVTRESEEDAKHQLEGLDLVIQNLLDGEAEIEEHNRRHPEHPYADVKDVLRQMCGDCVQARAVRDQQLKEEARKYNQ